jgi:hypothetical protein
MVARLPGGRKTIHRTISATKPQRGVNRNVATSPSCIT